MYATTTGAARNHMKIAIVHYWLVGMRGGEKVLESLCELFPQADIYTHIYSSDACSSIINRQRVYTTFIAKIPGAIKNYQRFLPLMPLALEQLDLSNYDLIISSESGPAKGIIAAPHAIHICYCHSPMRYIWDMYHDYRKRAGIVTRMLMPLFAHYLRIWDVTTSNRVDYFIANSQYVAKRISKYYHREASVIHPPVDMTGFSLADRAEDFYLMVGQLVPYKRADLAVEAFNQSGKKLVIIGDGELAPSLRLQARPNIELLGRQPDAVIRDYYARCKALIFPGVEDFGIVPLEAMASGRPVIGFAKGGLLETVVDGKTGIFFHQQTAQSLNKAVEKYEQTVHTFISGEIRDHASKFDKEIFKRSVSDFIDKCFSGSAKALS